MCDEVNARGCVCWELFWRRRVGVLVGPMGQVCVSLFAVGGVPGVRGSFFVSCGFVS